MARRLPIHHLRRVTMGVDAQAVCRLSLHYIAPAVDRLTLTS